MKPKLEKIALILFMIGGILLLGAAGNSDTGLPFIPQLFIGFTCWVVGIILVQIVVY